MDVSFVRYAVELEQYTHLKNVFLVLDQSNTFLAVSSAAPSTTLIISRVHFQPVLPFLKPEAGAPVSIALVTGFPQPSTPLELLEGCTVSLAIATKDIVVVSSKQWSEEELVWRPPWPGAGFEPRA